MYRYLFSDNRIFTLRPLICVCVCFFMTSTLAQVDEAQVGEVQVDEIQIDKMQTPAGEVIVEQALPAPTLEAQTALTTVEGIATETTIANKEPDATDEERVESIPEPPNDILNILGATISLGETRRLLWVAGETSYGSKLEAPVNIIRGKYPGPNLCLTAAIHGDELNGVEIVRRLISKLSAKKLHGTVIGEAQ